MIVDLLKTIEEIPADYPNVAGAEADTDYLWERIESYCAHRWTPRSVSWIVEGVGKFLPPLSPISELAAEKWQRISWEAITLDPSASGGVVLPELAEYRLTATVGENTVLPGAVSMAFLRLQKYAKDTSEGQAAPSGARSFDDELGGTLKNSFARDTNWLAKAIQNSGAGDLLRPYRSF